MVHEKQLVLDDSHPPKILMQRSFPPYYSWVLHSTLEDINTSYLQLHGNWVKEHFK